jgi:hypothetical protein
MPQSYQSFLKNAIMVVCLQQWALCSLAIEKEKNDA